MDQRKGNAYINGERYKLVVGLIHSKKPDGSPKLISLVYDKDSVDLNGGEEFVTVFLPAKMVAPGT